MVFITNTGKKAILKVSTWEVLIFCIHVASAEAVPFNAWACNMAVLLSTKGNRQHSKGPLIQSLRV